MVSILVISLGLAVAAKRMHARRKSHLEYAAIFARRGAEERKHLVEFDTMRRTQSISPNGPDQAKLEESSRRRIVYYAMLETKFRSAADRPWEAEPVIPPDPGEDLLWDAFFTLPKGPSIDPELSRFPPFDLEPSTNR